MLETGNAKLGGGCERITGLKLEGMHKDHWLQLPVPHKPAQNGITCHFKTLEDLLERRYHSSFSKSDLGQDVVLMLDNSLA